MSFAAAAKKGKFAPKNGEEEQQAEYLLPVDENVDGVDYETGAGIKQSYVFHKKSQLTAEQEQWQAEHDEKRLSAARAELLRLAEGDKEEADEGKLEEEEQQRMDDDKWMVFLADRGIIEKKRVQQDGKEDQQDCTVQGSNITAVAVEEARSKLRLDAATIDRLLQHPEPRLQRCTVKGTVAAVCRLAIDEQRMAQARQVIGDWIQTGYLKTAATSIPVDDKLIDACLANPEFQARSCWWTVARIVEHVATELRLTFSIDHMMTLSLLKDLN